MYRPTYLQKPPVGTRLRAPFSVSGGLWLMNEVNCGSFTDAAGLNSPAIIKTDSAQPGWCDGAFGAPAWRLGGSVSNSLAYAEIPLNGNNAFNWASGQRMPRTMWCWFRLPFVTSTGGPIIAKGNNSPDSGWSVSINSASGLIIGFIGSFNGRLTWSWTISRSVWHHLLVTWDGVSHSSATDDPWIEAYIDGQRVPHYNGSTYSSSTGGNQDMTDSFTLLIGKSLYSGGSGGASQQWCDCDIDHIGFDKRFYSEREAKRLYHSPFWMFEAPRKYWKLGGAAAAPATARGNFLTF